MKFLKRLIRARLHALVSRELDNRRRQQEQKWVTEYLLKLEEGEK